MQENGVKAGITENHLQHTFGCRILPKYRLDLLANCAEHYCYYRAYPACTIIQKQTMTRFFTGIALLSVLMIGGACKSQTSADASKKRPPAPPSGAIMAENRSHPLAKHIELVGFRLSEKGQGKLTVQFGVVNHSNADIADLGMHVTLRPVTTGAEEPGFCTLSAKLNSLGPREMKDVTGECPTTLRIYELPDWQFIRAVFEITSPSL
jgi:hypothetical protein